ncbi:hypothetical protein KL86PLE_40911 [uncultured Pleomorphomonas sp.]|uniref:Uncharacterized protein n=1 Tax=uncultured Pleomorphomonas sp. TaxID=442121 RepID=A0A212LHR8_9HYPH|nr:hypothetical protein KL86PLE_40911 [uncultured Pleomorphomonas sp.]
MIWFIDLLYNEQQLIRVCGQFSLKFRHHLRRELTKSNRKLKFQAEQPLTIKIRVALQSVDQFSYIMKMEFF